MMRDKGRGGEGRGGGGPPLIHDEGQGGEGVQLSDMMRDKGRGGGRGGGGPPLRHDEGQGEGRRGSTSQT